MTKHKKKIILDDYENEILEAYENGKLKPSKSQTDYKKIASNTLKKNKKINIRLSENDLAALQRRAAREGIPYQTLIGSVLHKYVSGYLEDFFTGIFATILSTPCSAPFLGVALAFAFTSPPVFTVTVFVFIGSVLPGQ